MVLFQVLKNGQNQFWVKKNWVWKVLGPQMFGPKKFGSEIIGLKKVRCSRTNAITGKAAIFIIAAKSWKKEKKTIAANFIKLNNNINKLLQI